MRIRARALKFGARASCANNPRLAGVFAVSLPAVGARPRKGSLDCTQAKDHRLLCSRATLSIQARLRFHVLKLLFCFPEIFAASLSPVHRNYQLRFSVDVRVEAEKYFLYPSRIFCCRWYQRLERDKIENAEDKNRRSEGEGRRERGTRGWEGNERERIEKTREKPSGVSRGKREKEGRRPTEPFKVPRRQQRASNELIDQIIQFIWIGERASE